MPFKLFLDTINKVLPKRVDKAIVFEDKDDKPLETVHPRNPIIISPEKRRQVLAQLEQGIPKERIARNLNISSKSVHRIAKTKSVLNPHLAEVEERKKKIIELTLQGKNNTEIANAIGISSKQVRRDKKEIDQELSKYGLKEKLPVFQKTEEPLPDQETINKVFDLYNSGITQQEIASTLGLKPRIVHRLISDPRYNVGVITRPWGAGISRAIPKNPKIGSFEDFYNTKNDKTEQGKKSQFGTRGKLLDRYQSFNVITPALIGPVSTMGKNINVLSLPHDYLFEKALLRNFNFDTINSYGFNLPSKRKEQTERALKVYKDSNHRIIPHIDFQDVNQFILTRRHDFKTIRPHATYGYGFFKPSYLPSYSEGFDIIDLDYLGFPGTTGSYKTRPNAKVNPWFGPVIAAKNLLKKGGLIMVSYLAESKREHQHGESIFQTVVKNKKNKMSEYNSSISPDSSLYLDPENPSNNVKRSFEGRENDLQKDWKDAAINANIYSKNIMDYANKEGVKLQPMWVNIYPGGIQSLMYRAIFRKI